MIRQRVTIYFIRESI